MKMPKPNGSGDYTPAPPGLHLAVCYSVVDLGTQAVEWQGEKKLQRKVAIAWELPDEMVETDRGSFPATIQNRYTFSSHEKAKLRHDLESWRGRAFTDDELDPANPKCFDIRNLLGKACQINVVHQTKNDKTYANIASIVPKPKGFAEPPTSNRHVYFSMDGDFDRATFAALPEWMQEMIKKSPEYQRANASSPSPGDYTGGIPDDDIPF